MFEKLKRLQLRNKLVLANSSGYSESKSLSLTVYLAQYASSGILTHATLLQLPSEQAVPSS